MSAIRRSGIIFIAHDSGATRSTYKTCATGSGVAPTSGALNRWRNDSAICSTSAPRERVKTKSIFRSVTSSRENNQILGEELRLARDRRAFQINRFTKPAAEFSGEKNNFSPLFISGDERAKKVWRNAAAAPTNAARPTRSFRRAHSVWRRSAPAVTAMLSASSQADADQSAIQLLHGARPDFSLMDRRTFGAEIKKSVSDDD